MATNRIRLPTGKRHRWVVLISTNQSGLTTFGSVWESVYIYKYAATLGQSVYAFLEKGYLPPGNLCDGLVIESGQQLTVLHTQLLTDQLVTATTHKLFLPVITDHSRSLARYCWWRWTVTAKETGPKMLGRCLMTAKEIELLQSLRRWTKRQGRRLVTVEEETIWRLGWQEGKRVEC